MFLRRRKSRTITLPRATLVRVPSHRSVTVHTVPRTVAEAYRPLVRKRPLPLPRNRRTVRRDLEISAPLELRLPRDRDAQPLKLAPLRRSSVRPLARRLRDCKAWKTPALNSPVCVAPRLFRALESLTVPRRVSKNDPTGIRRASLSGMKLRPFTPGTAALARAAPSGTLTNTLPRTGTAFTNLPSTGRPAVAPTTTNARRPAVGSLSAPGVGSTLPSASMARTWNV